MAINLHAFTVQAHSVPDISLFFRRRILAARALSALGDLFFVVSEDGTEVIEHQGFSVELVVDNLVSSTLLLLAIFPAWHHDYHILPRPKQYTAPVAVLDDVWNNLMLMIEHVQWALAKDDAGVHFLMEVVGTLEAVCSSFGFSIEEAIKHHLEDIS